MQFSGQKSDVVHLDINSCFATIEQQANPNLRNKPIVVCAYDSPFSIILASSIDAKRLGIKTGMKLSEGRAIYPKLIHLMPDPPKYRSVHKKIKKILEVYSEKVIPRSIDEYVFKLAEIYHNPQKTCQTIKQRIKEEVGEYITVSIGISTNRYLAKIASNLQKPDGLVEINKNNFLKAYSKINLTDLTGIKKGNARRLRLIGVKTVLQFYNSPISRLKIAFGGITGLYWYMRLHGFEIDDFKSKRRTFGNSFAPKKEISHKIHEILTKLCEKTGFRLRSAGFFANGVHLSIHFRNGAYWHKGVKTKEILFESRDIYKEVKRLLSLCPQKDLPRIIAISVFNLSKKSNLQLNFFEDLLKKEKLASSIDEINHKWGNFTIHPARMANMGEIITDRIAFGK